jgi:hypothetical protein
MGWLAWILCALGAWAVIAPFVFPWDVCLWVWFANIIPGALVFLLSGAYALLQRKALAPLLLVAAVLGVWLAVSPFAAGYYLNSSVTWANFLPGALIAVLGAAAGFLALTRD